MAEYLSEHGGQHVSSMLERGTLVLVRPALVDLIAPAGVFSFAAKIRVMATVPSGDCGRDRNRD